MPTVTATFFIETSAEPVAMKIDSLIRKLLDLKPPARSVTEKTSAFWAGSEVKFTFLLFSVTVNVF